MAHAVVAVFVVVTATAPYLYGRYLAPALVLTLGAVVLSRVRLPSTGVAWVLTLTTLGVASTAIGLANNNPGAWAMTSVFVFEPFILGMLFIALYATQGGRSRLYTTLDVALVAVATVGMLVYLSSEYGFQLPTWLVDERHSKADLSGSVLRSNFQGYNALVFLAPYGLLRGLSAVGGQKSWLWRSVLLAAAVSGVLLSGRRILYLVVPLAIVMVLVAAAMTRRARTAHGGSGVLGRLAAAVVAVGVVGWVLNTIGLGLGNAIAHTIGQVTLGDSSDIRAIQHRVLLDYWAQRPVFGHGAGSSAPGFVRDINSPWSYELTYHILLMSTGVVGVIVLGAWGLWVVTQLLRHSGRVVGVAPIAGGFIGAVLASTTNPYLLKLDGIWMVLIPFGVAAGVVWNKKEGTDE